MHNRSVTINDPEGITAEECLKLAQLGRERWNEWRREFPAKNFESKIANRANFRRCHFHSASLVNFFGFEFGDFADFSGTTFDTDMSFYGATFGKDASFVGASFRGIANFEKSHFGDRTTFARAKFFGYVTFSNSIFGADIQFSAAKFEGFSNFSRCQFGHFADFDEAKFGPIADFSAAIFRSVSFILSRFDRMAKFSGAMFGSADFERAEIGAFSSFSGETWDKLRSSFLDEAYFAKHQGEAKSYGLDPNAFGGLIFRGVKFSENVDFSEREFRGILDFGESKRKGESQSSPRGSAKKIPSCDDKGRLIFDQDENIVFEERKFSSGIERTKFISAPLFFGSKLTANTNFSGAIFPTASGNEKAANAYRVLKSAFAQQQAMREEQRFYRLEMAEEAAGEMGHRRWLYRIYQLISNFGFSLWRPVALLVATYLVSLVLYGMLAGLHVCVPWRMPCSLNADLIQFGLLQALPLPGFDKTIELLRLGLFSGANGLLLTLVVAAQKILSLLALFLIGLALRNLFKMK